MATAEARRLGSAARSRGKISAMRGALWRLRSAVTLLSTAIHAEATTWSVHAVARKGYESGSEDGGVKRQREDDGAYDKVFALTVTK